MMVVEFGVFFPGVMMTWSGVIQIIMIFLALFLRKKATDKITLICGIIHFGEWL